jgi:hypothetical protein
VNYLKQNTDGLDTAIKGLQSYLYDNIVSKWTLENFDAYGRVYKNKRNNLIIPEAYVSEKEYKEVLLDDFLDGIMFFSPYDVQDVYEDLIVQKCDVMFTFNLRQLVVSDERIDEEVRQYILSLFRAYIKDPNVTSITTGLVNVYKDYNGVAEYFYDMQDFHHFKMTVDLRYFNKNCI